MIVVVWLLRGVFGVLGAALLFANVVATKRVWASDLFETSQKIAQTALMWLVPGSVFIVWGVLREPRVGHRRDPPIAGVTFVVDWFVGTGDFAHDAGGSAQHDGGHHGTSHDGGHHDGFHGGGHHGGFGGGGHDGGGFGGHGGDGH
jgi:hypothetical protein